MDRVKKFKRLKEQLDKIGIPVAYYAFKNPVDTPFLVFYTPHVNNFVADNSIYMQQDYIELELYTDYKDFELEEKVREILTENEIIYEQYETYIENEKMFMNTFGFEI